MELEPYLEALRQEFAVAAEAAGPEAAAVAGRLILPLESSVRLALLEALSAAADEITRDLAPGSVHVRLRGREPQFVVTPAPAEAHAEAEVPPSGGALPAAPEGDDGAMARINLRLPEHLKNRVEQAADRGGLSVNSWLVRAAAAALDTDPGRATASRRSTPGGQRFTGWVR
jgi:predicted HicB family RNase H-like nuclease